MGEVFWKPLYFASILMFVISLILIPFSIKWAIIVALALIVIWTRIPGFVHFIFNTFAMQDLFGFIITATVGVPIGIGFHLFGLWFARLFGPDEWTPYTIRATISGFFAIILIPYIIKFSGGINLSGFFYYMVLNYIFYYALVLIFAREEIPIEIAVLPAALFFDFGMNLELFSIFGSTVSNMLAYGIESGWPFIIFAGVVLGLIFFSLNAKKIGDFIKIKWDSIFGKKEKNPEDDKKKEPTRGSDDRYSEYAEFFKDK
ncbi:MAG: hypothetical protein ABIH49_02545 [archaeon]